MKKENREKNILLLFVIFTFICLNLYIGFKAYQKSNYTDNFLRLHVVANSDSLEDQIEKLKVYETLNTYITTLAAQIQTNNTATGNCKEEVLQALQNNHETLLEIANTTLDQDAASYGSSLKIGSIHYDKKQSISYDMPSGNYDSVQLILGKGEGKNMWSLIFPNKENIESLEKYETILPGISDIFGNTTTLEPTPVEETKKEEKEEESTPQYSFKLLEWFQSLT